MFQSEAKIGKQNASAMADGSAAEKPLGTGQPSPISCESCPALFPKDRLTGPEFSVNCGEKP